MKRMIWNKMVLTLLAGSLLISCTTPPQKRYLGDKASIRKKMVLTGELETSKQEWTLIIGAKGNPADGVPFQLNATPFEYGYLLGTAFLDDDNNWTLYVDEYIWFNNWTLGWTSARFSALGTMKLINQGDRFKLFIAETPRIEHVNQASLRYKNDYFYGDEARDKIQHRWSRISAVRDFLQTALDNMQFDQRYYTRKKSINSFERRIRPVLFPEVYGYTADFPKPGKAEYSRGEGLKWNTKYTGEYCPDYLQAVRDSGTLYRDFEESPGLFYLAYSWTTLWDNVAAEIILKIKE